MVYFPDMERKIDGLGTQIVEVKQDYHDAVQDLEYVRKIVAAKQFYDLVGMKFTLLTASDDLSASIISQNVRMVAIDRHAPRPPPTYSQCLCIWRSAKTGRHTANSFENCNSLNAPTNRSKVHAAIVRRLLGIDLHRRIADASPIWVLPNDLTPTAQISVAQLRRGLSKGTVGSRNLAAMISQQGEGTRNVTPPEIKRAYDTAVRFFYSERDNTRRGAFSVLKMGIQKLIDKGYIYKGTLLTLPKRGDTLRKYIDNAQDYETLYQKNGKDQADSLVDGSKSVLNSKIPFEYVIIDHTVLDTMAIDDQTGFRWVDPYCSLNLMYSADELSDSTSALSFLTYLHFLRSLK